MVMHQAPTDPAYLPVSHFHIEFYPPNRTADKLKYLAGCELGGSIHQRFASGGRRRVAGVRF